MLNERNVRRSKQAWRGTDCLSCSWKETDQFQRLLSLLLTLALLLSLAACTRPEGVQHPTPTPAATPAASPAAASTPTPAATPSPTLEPAATPAPTAAPTPEPPAELLFLREHFPRIDGSTSLKPLDAAVRAGVFGTSYEEEYANVAHTTTWTSFWNLLDGSADLIYSVPLSKEQRTRAEDQGVELVCEPVSREGFVFVVNARNPVSALTRQQIRDIYSGKITNWKQVGGDDAPITAYQRNWDSGSQNYMADFMGETPLTDAPTELRPGTMSGLMDVIAAYDNGRYSIGYSVYTYAADMYYGAEAVKFLAVDGVAPSKTTMADGSYPLTGVNCAVFRADEPEDGPVRRLVRWVRSEEGQRAIAEAGCIAVEDIGFDYRERVLDAWRCTGTGGPVMPVDSYFYEAYQYMETSSSDLNVYYAGDLREEGLLTGLTVTIDCLDDKELEAEVNRFIAGAVARCDAKAPEFERQLLTINRSHGYDPDDPDSYMLYRPRQIGYEPKAGDYHSFSPAAIVEASAKNGWLSVSVSMQYTYEVQGGYDRCYYAECAVYDLSTGAKADPGRLFFDGVDVAAALNSWLSVQVAKPWNEFGGVYELNGDFAALPKTGWAMDAGRIYLFCEPFDQGVIFDLSSLPEGLMVTDTARPMDRWFTNDVHLCRRFRQIEPGSYEWFGTAEQKMRGDGLFSAAFLDESTPEKAAANADMRAWLESRYSQEQILSELRRQGWKGKNADLISGWGNDWYVLNYGNRWALFGNNWDLTFYDSNNWDQEYRIPDSCHWFLYDLTTGKRVTPEAVLREGWRDHCRIGYNSEYSGTRRDLDPSKFELSTIGFGMDEGGSVILCLQAPRPAEYREDDVQEYVNLYVDPEYIVW